MINVTLEVFPNNNNKEDKEDNCALVLIPDRNDKTGFINFMKRDHE